MTKFKSTILLTLFLLTVRCSSDSEVLASFESGNVTRKELREFFQIRGAKINEKTASVTNQSNVLEQLALQKMVHRDYLASEKISKELLDKLVNLTKGQMLITLYKQDFEARALREELMEFVTMQMAILRGTEEEPLDPNKSQEVLGILNSAKSESEIAEIIRKFTVDKNRKPIAGYIEPFCINCGTNPYADILEEPLKNGDNKFYLKEESGISYILRIVDTTKLHEKVLGRYIEKSLVEFQEMAKQYKDSVENPQEKAGADFYIQGNLSEKARSYADHLSKQFRNGLWEKEMERVKENSQVKVENVPNLTSPEAIDPKEFPDDRILAELPDGKKIDIGAFRQDFKELTDVLGRNQGDSPKEELWDVLNFFYNIYLSSLIMAEDESVKPTLESDLYKRSLKYLEYSLVWALFMQEITNEKIEVSESDIRDTYEAGKMFAYSKADPKNPDKRTPRPYSQVRDNIREELENQKRKSIFDSKLSRLKTDYNLKIATESLQEGKI